MFAKVFSQILDSSIAEDFTVRHVFMDLLVIADSEGAVDMTIPAIARRTNVPVKIVKSAIEKLSEPDGESRSKTEDGRRIIPIDSHRDWGWIIVNYGHYRAITDNEFRRSYFRDQKRLQREKAKCPQVVLDKNEMSTASTHADGEAEGEEKAKKKPASAKPRSEKKDSLHSDFIRRWSEEYEEHFGFKYAVAGGKDGKAVKTLLNHGTLESLLGVARNAWGNPNGFWCKQGTTIAGFGSKLNEIRTELAAIPKEPERIPWVTPYAHLATAEAQREKIISIFENDKDNPLAQEILADIRSKEANK